MQAATTTRTGNTFEHKEIVAKLLQPTEIATCMQAATTT